MRKRNEFVSRLTAAIISAAMLLPSVSGFAAKAQSPVAYDNVYNGTFEDGIIGKKADGWTLQTVDIAGNYDKGSNWRENYQMTIGGDAAKGRKSLKIAPKSGTRGYVVADSSLVKVSGNTGYNIDWSMKLSGIEERANFFGGKVFVAQYDANERELTRSQINVAPRDDMDWKTYAAYLHTEKETAYVRIGFYMGGVWNKNPKAVLYIDQVSIEQIPDDTLADGGFEKGSNLDSVYSWHMSSKNIHNEAEKYNWAENYTLKRQKNGYHGNCLGVTRNGTGYVSVDSNIMQAEGKTNYMLDYALRIENSVYDTFYGVRAYIAEYDAELNLIQNNRLHTEIRKNSDWQELSYSLVTTESTRYIQVQFWCGGVEDSRFTASFDDVSLTKVVRQLTDDGIHNGDFEERVEGTLLDWTLVTRAEDAKWELTFDGYNGTKGIKCTKASGEYSYEILRSNVFDVTAGADYKLTYMVRLANQAQNVYQIAQIVCMDAEGKVIERLRDGEFDHRTTSTDWMQEVGYFTMPEGTAKAQVEFMACGTGYICWLDDFKWSLRDDSASVWGFDTLDRDGNIAGWTVSQPIAAKADNKVWRNGSQSLFLSQRTATAHTTVTSDILIPLNKETRYKFNVYVKSYSSDVERDSGIRLNAMCYDETGKYLRKITGIRASLNASSQESEWKELVCGVSTELDVAYVRIQISIAPGTMNLWLDGLKWNIYDGNEYEEDFSSISSDGKPDGWDAMVVKGKPEFAVENGKVSIHADASSEGYIVGKWKSAKENTAFDVTTNYAAEGAEARLTIKYFDYSGREITSERLDTLLPDTGGVMTDYIYPIAAPSAAYAMLEFGNTANGTVSVSSIKITESEEDAQATAGPVTDWRGKWIWHYEDYMNVMYSTRYFRYHFTLPEAPIGGTLQITADDKVKLWVNGTEVVLDGADDWENVALVDTLADYLVAGDNTFAIEVYNGSSAAALLFDGYAEMADGTRVDFYSMDSAISTVEAAEGWQQPGYDDSTWSQCRIIGPVGTRPWSTLEFDASAFVSDKIELLDYTITEKMSAGDAAVLTMTVVPEEDIRNDIAFTGTLWVRNTTNDLVSISLTQTEGPKTSEWKKGEKVTVSYTFLMPEYLQSGKYILQLNINQIKITNSDVLNNKLMKAIRVTNASGKACITSEFRDLNGTQTLYIDDEPIPNMSYVLPVYQSFTNERADNYMHESGVCVTRVTTSVAGGGAPEVWTGPGEYDFTVFDSYIYNALSRHEDTKLMIQINMDVPQWWKDENPDELIVDSKNGRSNEVSFSSGKFEDDALAANRALIDYMMGQPYAQRIVGILLAACGTNEWIWFDLGQYALDYSPASETAFREFLTEKYGTDAALQKAWNDKTVTLSSAKVPPVEDRMGITYDTLLDPAIQQSTIDFHECMAHENVSMLKRFAKETKEAVNDRIIVGAYYGYMDNTYFYGNSNGTMHLGIGEVLDDENIDFFCSPVLYNERYDGEAASYMTMIDSILAHGKAFMCENDNRLCSYVDLSSNFYTREAVGPTYNVWDSLSQIERDFSSQLTKGCGQWWFNMWGNFFSNQQFSDVIGTMFREQKVSQERKTEYKSDICYIVDEDMYTYLAYTNFNCNYDLLYWLLYQQRQELARIGTTFDMYYMSDLAKGVIPEYKIYVMLSPVDLDKEEREAIEKYMKRDDSTIIWQYAPGISDGTSLSAKNIEDVTGFRVSLQKDAREFTGIFADKKHELLDGLRGDYYGITTGNSAISPAVVITDKEAETLGYYKDTGDVSCAVKKMDGWTSVYTTIPCLPAQFFRNLLKENGKHIYSEDRNVVVLANDRYVAVNSAYGADTEIHLDSNYSVYDVYRHQSYALDTDTITADLEDNTTRLYRLMKAGTHGVYAAAGEGGSADHTGFKEYKDGDDVKLTFKAEKGYELAAIVVDGEETAVTGKKYTVRLEKLDNSHYVEARFTKLTGEEAVASDDSMKIPWFVWVSSAVAAAVLAVVIVYVARKRKHAKCSQEEQH